METSEEPKDKVIEQLEILNARMERQSKVGRIFFTGIVYGVGFFIGSAIIATIALGIFGPIFGEVGWVEEKFKRGSEILHSN